MKINKIFSIDFELVERLKEEKNASGLVNQLLEEHYSESRDNLIKKLVDIKTSEAREKITAEVEEKYGRENNSK